MTARRRLIVSRALMAMFPVIALVAAVASFFDGDPDIGLTIAAVAWVLLAAWWFHLWGWRGDPPPGARNRLPWQK